MQGCYILDDLMYHFIIKTNKMKEPNEIKSMQNRINQIYRNKKNSTVKENYKNIDVLPTVYDDSEVEGFKLFKKMGKGLKKAFKPWKAPYVGPPKDGKPIEEINDHPSENLVNIIDKGSHMMSFFEKNADLLSQLAGTKKSSKIKPLTFDQLTQPFQKCPCVKIFPLHFYKLSYWYQFAAFFTDTIPCLTDQYSELTAETFAGPNSLIEKDKEIVKSSIVEFFYLFIACYLALLFFYYTVLDTSNFVNPAEFFPETGFKSFDFFVVKRLAYYMTFPIVVFNTFFNTILPAISRKIGVLPYNKLNYIFLFLVAIALVFNGSLNTFADMLKSSFQFRANATIYLLLGVAIIVKIFDLEIIYNIREFASWQTMPILFTVLVLLLITFTFAMAPVVQLIFVIYVANLFLLRPLMNLFQEIEDVARFLFDTSNDTTCNLPSGEFFGELARLVTKYIFPYLFPLVMIVFFVYRFSLCYNITSTELQSIMMMMNTLGVIALVSYISFFARRYKNMTKEVNLNPEAGPAPGNSVPPIRVDVSKPSGEVESTGISGDVSVDPSVAALGVGLGGPETANIIKNVFSSAYNGDVPAELRDKINSYFETPATSRNALSPDSLTDLKKFLTSPSTDGKEMDSAVVNKVQSIVDDFTPMASDIMTKVQEKIKNSDGSKSSVNSAIMEGFREGFSKATGMFKDKKNELMDSVKKDLDTIGDKFGKARGMNTEGVKKIGDLADGLANKGVNVMDNIEGAVKSSRDPREALSNTTKIVKNEALDAVKGIKKKIPSVMNEVKAASDGLKNGQASTTPASTTPQTPPPSLKNKTPT